VLIAIICFICQSISIKNGTIKVRPQKYKIRDGQIGVPVTFHPYTSESVQVHEIQYYKVIQCVGGQGDNTQAQISLILPNNPTWMVTKGRILFEVSKCADSFDSSCVLYNNYIWNSGISTKYYSNITFDIDNSVETLYIRVTSRTFPSDYSFQLSYVSNAQNINGEYSYEAFDTSQVNGPYSPVAQYVKTSSVQSVDNFEIVFYFIQFCISNFANAQSNWEAMIEVASSTQKPKSAFEIWGCSFDDGTQNCAPSHNDGEDLSAVSVVAFSMQNDQNTNLNDGFYIGVYGIGGEYDSINEAILSVTTSFYN